MNLSAFILAAGLGERLLPITKHIPKPLLPILGKPILQSVVEKLFIVPIDKIGINLHHKRDDIEQWIKQSPYAERISFFPEDPILGTGGALKNAEGFLEKGPFLVHNADIMSEIDLGELVDYHLSSGNLATLAVHNLPSLYRLTIDAAGLLKGLISHEKRSIAGCKPVAFTGISVYQPEFLRFLPFGNSSVVDAWLRALSDGQRIGTMDVSGCYWTDIGTPSAYAHAVTCALRKNGENIYIHRSAEGCTQAAVDGYVVIERGGRVEGGVSLRNCISLPGTTVGSTCPGEVIPECFPSILKRSSGRALKKRIYENCIVGSNFIVQLSESDFYTTDDHGNFFIGAGGSDRKYFRVKKDHYSAVLMQCAENDPDFQRHVELTKFFRRCAVPVPELLSADNQAQTALFDDLGDISLYSWLKCPRPKEQVEAIFRKVLDILVAIQTTVTRHASECPLLYNRIFDYEHLRWETRYFLERFVIDVKNIQLWETAALENEFHALAALVDSFPKTIVHRDFQSQNIMIGKGSELGILDFQGARMGPPAYDVASLLWDPYCRLEDNVRERLLDYYISKVNKKAPFKGEFLETILPCRLQRHMQALGAYGFLSTVKGKSYFRKYMPEGVRLLKEDIIESGYDYPALRAVIMEL